MNTDLKHTKTNRPTKAIDRIPPHSMESEQGVLSCILMEPQTVIPQCIEILGETVESFYDLRHQTIYAAMLSMSESRQGIDIITLQQFLKNDHSLEEVGGLSYLSSLMEVTPSAANLEYYANIVREKSLLRRYIQACSNIVARIYDFEGEVDQLSNEIEQDILKISHSRILGTDKSARELVKESLNDIEAMWNRQGAIGGIPTGFPDLDRLIDGLHRGEMAVIAARPSMGKTALMMQIFEHISVDLKMPVGIFSLEMPARSLMTRMLCSRARINLRSVRDGVIEDRDFPKLTNAGLKIAAAPLYIEERSGLSIVQIRAKALRWHQQFGIRALGIDYLQLASSIGSKRKFENRQQEITEISAGIKNLAKDLDIPIVVLSQLNREVEKDKVRKPRMADLRESGSIEQDADVIGFLYKPIEDKTANGHADGDMIQTSLLIAKQRNGPAGEDVPLVFQKRFTRFESAARISDQDAPGAQ